MLCFIQKQWSFSVFSDVCLPVLLLVIMVVWGYQLNAIIVDNDGDNHLMLLIYGIGLIVVSGTSCAYIIIRMEVIRPEKTTRYLQREVNFYNHVLTYIFTLHFITFKCSKSPCINLVSFYNARSR